MPDATADTPISIEARNAIGDVLDNLTDWHHQNLCACGGWPDNCCEHYTRAGLEPAGAEEALEVAVRMAWSPPQSSDVPLIELTEAVAQHLVSRGWTPPPPLHSAPAKQPGLWRKGQRVQWIDFERVHQGTVTEDRVAGLFVNVRPDDTDHPGAIHMDRLMVIPDAEDGA